MAKPPPPPEFIDGLWGSYAATVALHAIGPEFLPPEIHLPHLPEYAHITPRDLEIVSRTLQAAFPEEPPWCGSIRVGDDGRWFLTAPSSP
jgi:hypothetical protein